MTAGQKVLATALTILAVAGAGGRASAAWVVDARGKCVERWSADSLLRGPTAMLMSPTAPFRNAAGVFTYQSPETGGWTGQGAFFFWGPALALVSGAAGIVDTCVWLGTGLADTMTGGYFAIAPPRATELTLDPLIPPFMSAGQRDSIEAKRPDPCGRVPARS